jgi:hypothetical protein
VLALGGGGTLWYLGNKELDQLYSQGCKDFPDGKVHCPETVSFKRYDNLGYGMWAGIAAGGTLIAASGALFYLAYRREQQPGDVQVLLSPMGASLAGSF